jgi:hypothetical protein
MKSKREIKRAINKLKIERDRFMLDLEFAEKYPEDNMKVIPILKESINRVDSGIEWLCWALDEYEKYLGEGIIEAIKSIQN